MANSPDFIAHVLELMRPTARATARAMFGGHGLYADGIFFAIVADDTLYLKCDDTTRARFEALDLPPFVYTAKDGKGMAMSYRRAPDDALDSAPAMRPWLRLALDAALRSAAARTGRKRSEGSSERTAARARPGKSPAPSARSAQRKNPRGR